MLDRSELIQREHLHVVVFSWIDTALRQEVPVQVSQVSANRVDEVEHALRFLDFLHIRSPDVEEDTHGAPFTFLDLDLPLEDREFQ